MWGKQHRIILEPICEHYINKKEQLASVKGFLKAIQQGSNQFNIRRAHKHTKIFRRFKRRVQVK